MLNFLPALLLFLIHGSSELGGTPGNLAFENSALARASLGRTLPTSPAALQQLHSLIQRVLQPVQKFTVPAEPTAERTNHVFRSEPVFSGPALSSDRTRDGPGA